MGEESKKKAVDSVPMKGIVLPHDQVSAIEKGGEGPQRYDDAIQGPSVPQQRKSTGLKNSTPL